MKVAVIGLGVIGQANSRMLEAAGWHVTGWDKAGGEPYPDLAGHDWAMICTGTPRAADGSADVSSVRDALAALPPDLPALIRSTVPPGTTDELAGSRPGLTAHWPEFMHERPGAAWPESSDVPFLILGGSAKALKFFAPQVRAARAGRRVYQCTATEAELAKYAANLHWATKVTFVSEMAAVAAAVGADWERVREAWCQDPRVSGSYTRMAGFEPGFGGRCWPKDLAALTAASAAAGYRPRFLEAVAEANDRFTRPAPTWDLLICAIPHRHDKLAALLAELGRQIRPGVGVRVYRDNLETAYGGKCQALVDSSAADYVSFVDDDDLVAPDFVRRVTAALAERPDYVGFPVRWTLDGVQQMPVEHSLRHGGWTSQPGRLLRDIVHFNPIRRDLALLGRWEGGYAADGRWADQVRASGQVQTEAWIPEPMYYYRNSAGDTFQSAREPWRGEIPELPAYEWLTVL